MPPIRFTAMAILLAAPLAPALAQEHRELGAHEHGVGQLDMAIEGGRISMELRAPGADIVGFEHAARSDADREAVTLALSKLEAPLALFVLPDAAGCTVALAHAELDIEAHESDEAHDHDEDHAHEDAHDEQAHEDHDDHEHDDHADENDDHAPSHSEFHAEYALDCAAPSELTQITFAYFEAFPNALELELQLLSDQGAQAFEIDRQAPVLDLAGRL